MKNPIILSLCAALACSVVRADELSDWNHMMLTATLTAPVTPPRLRLAWRQSCRRLSSTRSTESSGSTRQSMFHLRDRQALPYAPPPCRLPTPRSWISIPLRKPHSISSAPLPWPLSRIRKARFRRGWPGVKASPIRYGRGEARTDSPIRSRLTWAGRPPASGGQLLRQWRRDLRRSWRQTTPWVLRSPSQFRPAGPPALTSDQYTADYNEVKNMGASTNSGRTADQTLYSNFWQAGNPPDYFDPVVISLAAKRHFSMVETARLLALVNLGMADAIIGCWDAKYTYSSWRPITAITLGDTDGNDCNGS